MQPHAGRPHSSPPSSSSRFSPTTTDPSRDVGELVDAAEDRRFQERRSALTPLFDLCGNQPERRQFASEQASRRWRGGRRDDSRRTRRKFDSHTEFDAYEAMTSRIGVPRLTRMTVISPVFLLCARTVIMPSSPDDGAAADGRLLVDVTEFVLLVTEFLLSFVGTRAGRKLSSDIDFSFSEPPVS